MRTGSTRLTTVIAAIALGAASMYVFDPDKGRRRRAMGRDKVRQLRRRRAELRDGRRA